MRGKEAELMERKREKVGGAGGAGVSGSGSEVGGEVGFGEAEGGVQWAVWRRLEGKGGGLGRLGVWGGTV
jgi:hypothetical protein